MVQFLWNAHDCHDHYESRSTNSWSTYSWINEKDRKSHHQQQHQLMNLSRKSLAFPWKSCLSWVYLLCFVFLFFGLHRMKKTVKKFKNDMINRQETIEKQEKQFVFTDKTLCWWYSSHSTSSISLPLQSLQWLFTVLLLYYCLTCIIILMLFVHYSSPSPSFQQQKQKHQFIFSCNSHH